MDMPGRKKLEAKELGASLVEYGLLVALVALIAIPSVRVLGSGIKTKFNIVGEEVQLGAGNLPPDD